MDRTGQVVAQDRFGLGELGPRERAKPHAEFALVLFRRLDGEIEGSCVAMQMPVARAADQIVGMGFANEDVVLRRRIGDQPRPGVDRLAMPLWRRMPPVAEQGLDMEMKRRQAVAHVIGAAGRDLQERSEVARHRIGTQGFGLDHPGIAVAGLAARLPAVDERDRPAALPEVQRRAHADHSAAEDNCALHRTDLAKSKPPGLAGRS
ncbi:hypothetical protein ACVIU4_005501 [Bradyrhizobium barranii subsp. barranii]